MSPLIGDLVEQVVQHKSGEVALQIGEIERFDIEIVEKPKEEIEKVERVEKIRERIVEEFVEQVE